MGNPWLPLALASFVVVACGGGATNRSAPATTRDDVASTNASSAVSSSAGPTVEASPAATPAASPGDYGSLPQAMVFSPARGRTPPAWLPSHIRLAPPAPSTATCGVDARGTYRAIVRFDPRSGAGAVTIQINAYHGPGTYANRLGRTDVDVEVSPPRSDLTGLAGFQQPSTVSVAPDGLSGYLDANLQSGNAFAGILTGAWRCG